VFCGNPAGIGSWGLSWRRNPAVPSSTESALVVLVPEAEALVKPFRDRHDPSAAVGVPAHITLLYPFKPPDEIGAAVLDDLRGGFARLAPFRFSLASIRRFPAVLYLAPEPDEPFRRLTSAIRDWYPETPPYGGRWPEIVPHLTVANLADEHRLEGIAGELAQASRCILPIDATAAEIALMDNRSGRWQIRARFGLGCE
jgi:2'-5' RNA ligase